MIQEDSSMTLSTSPVPLTTIEYNLSALGISDREIRGLLSHSEFPSLQFRSHQICFLHDYPCNSLNRPLNTTELSTVFEVTTAVIRRTIYGSGTKMLCEEISGDRLKLDGRSLLETRRGMLRT
jgi:hypothetical protein